MGAASSAEQPTTDASAAPLVVDGGCVGIVSKDLAHADREAAARIQTAFMSEYGVSADFIPIVRLELDADERPFSWGE